MRSLPSHARGRGAHSIHHWIQGVVGSLADLAGLRFLGSSLAREAHTYSIHVWTSGVGGAGLFFSARRWRIRGSVTGRKHRRICIDPVGLFQRNAEGQRSRLRSMRSDPLGPPTFNGGTRGLADGCLSRVFNFCPQQRGAMFPWRAALCLAPCIRRREHGRTRPDVN